ncbi:MAG TPA: ATP synthase subunit I [Syntrophales bacterium]|nr:ATP synthase subunit I [Syntrophales bacterium]
MTDTAILMASLAAGAILGIVYFHGLWHTVVRLPDFKRPAWSMSWSYAARVVMAMSGFYVIMGGHLERLAMAMAGFILARQFLVRRMGRMADTT